MARKKVCKVDKSPLDGGVGGPDGVTYLWDLPPGRGRPGETGGPVRRDGGGAGLRPLRQEVLEEPLRTREEGRMELGLWQQKRRSSPFGDSKDGQRHESNPF